MPKTLKELRKVRSQLVKHMVVLRLSASEEEKLISVLEKERITFSAFVQHILQQELNKEVTQ